MKKQRDLRFWFSIAAEIAVAIALFTAISYWQERHMLNTESEIPKLSAVALDGKTYQVPRALTAESERKTLLYFFAPWCNICHISIGNLNILRSQIDESKLDIVIVALDWKSQHEVEEFMADHDLDFPVLLGNRDWQQQYKIQGFPSYYVLDHKGNVLSHSMGYSSSIGMLRRTLL